MEEQHHPEPEQDEGPKRHQAIKRAEQREHGKSMRAWFHERRVAAQKRAAEQRKAAAKAKTKRGADRVPKPLRVGRPDPYRHGVRKPDDPPAMVGKGSRQKPAKHQPLVTQADLGVWRSTYGPVRGTHDERRAAGQRGHDRRPRRRDFKRLDPAYLEAMAAQRFATRKTRAEERADRLDEEAMAAERMREPLAAERRA